MIKKILKYSLIVLVVCLIIVLSIIVIKRIRNNNEEIKTGISDVENASSYGCWSDEYLLDIYGVKNLTDDEKEQLKYYKNHVNEYVLKMMQPNQNWEVFPIEKELREQLHNEIREVAKYNFDTVEYSENTLNNIKEYGSTGYLEIIGTKDKKKVMFTFLISTYDGLCELTLKDEKMIQDEEGNKIDTRLICNEKNWNKIVEYFVSYDDELKKSIAVTERFSNKYPTFEDAFIKQVSSYNDYTSLVYSDETIEQSDFLNLFAVYKAYKRKKGKKRYKSSDENCLFRVEFILDDKRYIDDVKITQVSY